ncbi:PLP-dependent aminotransferase family protein [Brenneria corticis]|uniref:GntR family transcriptional regulator n=1 Tax=Brenneria corticis TaxID=2173106 RepID=A0A2U1U4X5_9GAMM|nr:PLP-dependent aminotransferase family protein [Brenneria sp. CFCC 11842]PWC16713.1 GntR family transcriptional regulator [Brenneria sp. CFCC 11842]
MSGKCDEHVDAEWLAKVCLSREPSGIAQSIIHLINTRELMPGARLPTVRDLAVKLDVSSSTIANVWAKLRSEGFVDTRRRGGTYIIERMGVPEERRDLPLQLDLSTASPDPALQFDLAPALIAGLKVNNLHSAELDYVIEPLAKYAESSWPFPASDWIITGASSESILVSLSAVAKPGSVVAVEQPTTPRLLQIMSLLGIIGIGVEWDHEGPQVASLESALEKKPVAFIFQPRAHLPLGLSMSVARAKELADVLKHHPNVRIIEDDPLGPICSTPAESIGKWLPERTILVRSFCKAFGLDLRSSIIGGSPSHIAAIKQSRASGLGMGSRILQGALLHILTDPDYRNRMDEIRQEYILRRAELVGCLDLSDSDRQKPGDGLCIWLPVHDELQIVSTLASKNVLVGSGNRYYLQEGPPHIAIHIGNLSRANGMIQSVAALLNTARISVAPVLFD